METFDFVQGGEFSGCYYPALKPMKDAIKFSYVDEHVGVYQYEPGNGTRYDVIINEVPTPYGMQVVLTLVNFRKSMIIPSPMGMHSLGYMVEKLNINPGDCYALLPLINCWFSDN